MAALTMISNSNFSENDIESFTGNCLFNSNNNISSSRNIFLCLYMDFLELLVDPYKIISADILSFKTNLSDKNKRDFSKQPTFQDNMRER